VPLTLAATWDRGGKGAVMLENHAHTYVRSQHARAIRSNDLLPSSPPPASPLPPFAPSSKPRLLPYDRDPHLHRHDHRRAHPAAFPVCPFPLQFPQGLCVVPRDGSTTHDDLLERNLSRGTTDSFPGLGVWGVGVLEFEVGGLSRGPALCRVWDPGFGMALSKHGRSPGWDIGEVLQDIDTPQPY